MLDGRAHPNPAYLGTVAAFECDAPRPDNRLDHFALWAQHRQDREGSLPLERCVVGGSNRELTAAQLIGVPEMAKLGATGAVEAGLALSFGTGAVEGQVSQI